MLGDALRTSCDVLHAHAFGHFPTWAGSLSRRLRGTPLVITPHSDEGLGTAASRLYQRAVARVTLVGADRVIAQTRIEAERLSSWGVDRSRIVVIPTPIDLDEFPEVPDRLPPSSGGPTILFVGRLVPVSKGLDVLVRAFARLPEGLSARLRIVGEDWGAGAPLLRLARELGVASRVTLLGAISKPDLRREYAGADLFVLPSRAESFGAVLLEAMASGLPVVATRVGGIPEVVEEGATALLVPPDDVDALSQAVRRLAEDPELSRRLSRSGRPRAETFSWTRLTPRYVELFEELRREAGTEPGGSGGPDRLVAGIRT